eukprot:4550229-Amphidinium_carterae.1
MYPCLGRFCRHPKQDAAMHLKQAGAGHQSCGNQMHNRDCSASRLSLSTSTSTPGWGALATAATYFRPAAP